MSLVNLQMHAEIEITKFSHCELIGKMWYWIWRSRMIRLKICRRMYFVNMHMCAKIGTSKSYCLSPVTFRNRQSYGLHHKHYIIQLRWNGVKKNLNWWQLDLDLSHFQFLLTIWQIWKRSYFQHKAIACNYRDRTAVIANILRVFSGDHGRSIVFCETKRDADRLAANPAIRQETHALHGDIPQATRERVLKVSCNLSYQLSKILVVVPDAFVFKMYMLTEIFVRCWFSWLFMNKHICIMPAATFCDNSLILFSNPVDINLDLYLNIKIYLKLQFF